MLRVMQITSGPGLGLLPQVRFSLHCGPLCFCPEQAPGENRVDGCALVLCPLFTFKCKHLLRVVHSQALHLAPRRHQPLRRWCLKAQDGRGMSQRKEGISPHCWRLFLHPSHSWSEGSASHAVMQLTFETESDPQPSYGVWASLCQGIKPTAGSPSSFMSLNFQNQGRVPGLSSDRLWVKLFLQVSLFSSVRLFLTHLLHSWLGAEYLSPHEGCSLKCPASHPGDCLRDPTSRSGRWAPVPASVMVDFCKLLGLCSSPGSCSLWHAVLHVWNVLPPLASPPPASTPLELSPP